MTDPIEIEVIIPPGVAEQIDDTLEKLTRHILGQEPLLGEAPTEVDLAIWLHYAENPGDWVNIEGDLHLKTDDGYANTATVHRTWRTKEKGKRGAHPLAYLVHQWLISRGREPRDVNLVVPHVSTSVSLTRAPHLLSLANVAIEAIEVDGLPRVSASLPVQGVQGYRRRPMTPQQLELNLRDAVSTFEGNNTNDTILSTLAQFPLDGDERKPLRTDIYRLALLTFAATQRIKVDAVRGARFLTGGYTPGAVKRWWAALEALHHLVIHPKGRPGPWYQMASIEIGAGEVAHIAPPRWWQEQRREARGFRLSGGLFRPPLLGDAQKQGTDSGYWSVLHRTITGLESALGYGRAGGRGKDGRISQWLRPARGNAGAGQPVMIPWYVLLALSGEFIDIPKGRATPSQTSHPAEYKRFQRRVDGLKAAGYLTSGRREAEAGDTVELTAVKRGSRWESAGVVIRASAAYVAGVKAAQKPSNWTLIPADRVLLDPQISANGRPS